MSTIAEKFSQWAERLGGIRSGEEMGLVDVVVGGAVGVVMVMV